MDRRGAKAEEGHGEWDGRAGNERGVVAVLNGFAED